MKVEIKVPSMGESISQATVGSIIKSSGSSVRDNDELLELETDKVNQVLYATQAGVVEWSVKKDDVVTIGQVLGYIDSEKTASAPAAEEKRKPESAKASEEKMKSEVPREAENKKNAPKAAAEEFAELPKLAEPQNAISRAPGSTPVPQQKARITKESFIAGLSNAPREPQTQASTAPKTNIETSASAATAKINRAETRKPMSRIRKVIATRLVEAMRQSAMLTTFNEVDMSKIMALRETYKEAFTKEHNIKLGFMSFFVKAVVSALKAFPGVNAYIDGDDIVYRSYFDIGIAVGTDKGVIVPVLRGCDSLSFADIERSLESYAAKSREGKIAADDLQGGGFTITNGGVYGSLLSTPLLNPPQCAILGMHKISKRAVVVDDEIVIRPMMYLALSYDHRLIDGKEAVSFLVHIKNCLEDPDRLLLGI